MKFTGTVIGKRPTIPVLFEVRLFNISKMVHFLVDTGSLFSAITEKEAMLIGLDCTTLPESKREAVGFGGTFTPKVINRLVSLTFRSGKDEHKIRISSVFMVICIPLNVTLDQSEKLLRYTPNVLGMDTLTKFKTYVNKNKVVLTLTP